MPSRHRERFKRLHTTEKPLFLPNAWDVASARILVRSGASAVATSSASLSWSLGYPDGGKLSTPSLLSVVGSIIRNLAVPLTVDIEDGFSPSAREVAAFVEQLSDLGVAGVNIEDGNMPSSLLAEKISAIRHRPNCRDLFINARTDIYLRALASPDDAAGEVINRAREYQSAGADGLFVPGVHGISDMSQIGDATSLLLNVMTIPGLPPAEQLAHCGVARISTGPFTFLSAYQYLADTASDFVNGRFEGLFQRGLSYENMNALVDG